MSEVVKEDGAQGVVPRLRFPEFKTGAAWWIQPLGEACTVNPPIREIPASFIYVDLESVEKGQLTRKTKIQRDEAPSRAQRVLQDQDVLFQIVRPYQRNNFLFHSNGEEDYVASTGYAQLRARTSASFLYQSIHTDGFVARVVAKCTGSNYPAINPSDLAGIPVAIPEDVEQKKIAACLSSLDDLIAAHADKLAALKQHKQGLLEQLFPREGETVPRLRFPEFRNETAWSLTPIAQLCDSLDGDRKPVTKSDRRAGAYPYYGASGIVDYVDSYVFDEELVLVGEDGAKWGAYESTAFVASGRYWVNNHAHVLRANGIIAGLLAAYLCKIDLSSYVTGAAPPKLTGGKLARIPVPVANKPEQQKIAGCLSSLDGLIAAESDKLAALKQHKQGLLQQLFPTLDEVAA